MNISINSLGRVEGNKGLYNCLTVFLPVKNPWICRNLKLFASKIDLCTLSMHNKTLLSFNLWEGSGSLDYDNS